MTATEGRSPSWPCEYGHASKTAGCTDCVEISGRTTGRTIPRSFFACACGQQVMILGSAVPTTDECRRCYEARTAPTGSDDA